MQGRELLESSILTGYSARQRVLQLNRWRHGLLVLSL